MFSDRAVFTLHETPCSEVQACRFMLTAICVTRSGGGGVYCNMNGCILLIRSKSVSYSKVVRANSGHLHDNKLEIRKSLIKKHVFITDINIQKFKIYKSRKNCQ
jgi:hypothetical protein